MYPVLTHFSFFESWLKLCVIYYFDKIHILFKEQEERVVSREKEQNNCLEEVQENRNSEKGKNFKLQRCEMGTTKYQEVEKKKKRQGKLRIMLNQEKKG